MLSHIAHPYGGIILIIYIYKINISFFNLGAVSLYVKRIQKGWSIKQIARSPGNTSVLIYTNIHT